jgi:hypothetical protein
VEQEKGDLIYKFVDDSSSLDEYINLRKSLYKEDEKFKGFRFFDYIEKEDYEDLSSKILIVKDKNRCVGGARLTISRPEKRIMLPLEENISLSPLEDKGRLSSLFPEISLENQVYGEFSRIVLEPKYRSGLYTKQIFYHILNMAKKEGITYMFGMGDAIRSRLYKQIYSGFGLKVQIRKDITLPDKATYEGIKMYIMTMSLEDLNTNHDNSVYSIKETA